MNKYSMVKNFVFVFLGFCAIGLVISCAGQRQGVVCDEIEYRLNSMSYSPDQRYYMEDELRACREEEAQKKAESAKTRQSIYDRFMASDSSKTIAAPDTSAVKDTAAINTSATMNSTAIVDSLETADSTETIDSTAADTVADTSAVE